MNIKKTFLILYDKENEAIAAPLVEYFTKAVPDHYVLAFDDSVFNGTRNAKVIGNISNFVQQNFTGMYKFNEKIICDNAVKKARRALNSNRDLTYDYKKFKKAVLEKRYKRFINIYTRFLTDTVFCLSPKAASLALNVRNLEKADYKVFCYHTELSLNPRYIQPNADGFFVPNEKVKDSLIQMGVAPESVNVIGFPSVKVSDFDKNAVKEALGIKSDLPVIVFSGGDYRYKSIKPFFAEFLNVTDKYVLVVNTGVSSSEKFRKIMSDKVNEIAEPGNVFFFKNKDKNFDIRIADIAIVNFSLGDIYKLLVEEIPTIVINPLFDREKDMINLLQLKQLLFYACYPYSAKEIIISQFSDEKLQAHKERLSEFKNQELLLQKTLPEISFEQEENIVLEGGTKLMKSTNAPEITESRRKREKYELPDYEEDEDFTPLDDEDAAFNHIYEDESQTQYKIEFSDEDDEK